MAEHKAVKVLLAKLGLDDHTRPLYVLAQGLRDAGLEVIFLGTHNTPERVVRVALEEDVDAITLSFHTLGHIGWLTEVMGLLRVREAAERVAVFAGGIIPEDDWPTLAAMGVKGFHGPGTPVATIAEGVRREVERKKKGQGEGP
ncbi:MAG: cobalamin B12-binding domain-containing protein [Candidatus Rokubacteria bacterium]|nr:cobalamin B12-binding domain-containing protein [Candidatus Rokubacteria bacterium]